MHSLLKGSKQLIKFKNQPLTMVIFIIYLPNGNNKLQIGKNYPSWIQIII
jgi:hypothetical protein